MIEVAQWDAADRRDLFQEAASRRGLSFDVIQKDFWVCFVLDRLFSDPEVGKAIYFKGGTSLSKCFHLIERFSEDVDLTVSRGALGFDDSYLAASPTPSQLKKRRRLIQEKALEYTSSKIRSALAESISTALGPPDAWELMDSGHGILEFRFPADSELTIGSYMRPEVKLEIGGLSDLDLSAMNAVTPYAAEEIAEAFGQRSTEVRVVLARRTLCDKLLLVHRLNTSGDEIPPENSRHFYDVAMMAGAPVREELLADPGLLARAIQYEGLTFPRRGIDYDALRPEDLQLFPPEDLVRSLRSDHESMAEMFFSAPPSLDALLTALQALEQDLRNLPELTSD